MPETLFYRGPSGTVIELAAVQRELDAIGRNITMHWSRGPDADAIRLREEIGLPDESPVLFELYAKNGIGPLASEEAPATERVEGLARLLRRVLPEPAKVISHMSDEQWADFQGSKADA